ncbi:hypothetical protein CRYUN_Cryun15aG0122400 [Craigia yunnanensis]
MIPTSADAFFAVSGNLGVVQLMMLIHVLGGHHLVTYLRHFMLILHLVSLDKEKSDKVSKPAVSGSSALAKLTKASASR